MTPEILYGIQILNKKIETYSNPKYGMDFIWSIDPVQKIINLKDQKLTEKISPSLTQYFHIIEEAVLFKKFFRTPENTIDDLAKNLNIPKYHLTYVFKYHSKESYSNFKKIIRIQDAINILKSGYLASHTLESLSTEVGFSSYTSFYLSFKEITGKSPQEYLVN
jgi:AraC-like DNA-binding protein